MPIYCYKCECGKVTEVFEHLPRPTSNVTCKCGGLAERSFSAEGGCKKFAECEGFFSDTMGVHPEQVAGEVRRHPNWKFNNKGQLWIENLKDQRKKVKELGMVNYDDN